MSNCSRRSSDRFESRRTAKTFENGELFRAAPNSPKSLKNTADMGRAAKLAVLDSFGQSARPMTTSWLLRAGLHNGKVLRLSRQRLRICIYRLQVPLQNHCILCMGALVEVRIHDMYMRREAATIEAPSHRFVLLAEAT